MGDSDAVRPGDWCLAMGNPFLLAKYDFAPTVTYGIVSGTHRYQEPAGTFLEYTDCLQIDASVNPGNSGGPLFGAEGSQRGKLIGINGRISVKRGRVNSGAAYAISVNQVRHFLGHLRSGRVLDHGTLNATVRTDYDGTVVFDRVAPGSSADRRGVREGDELVEFVGRPVRSVNQFKNVPRHLPRRVGAAADRPAGRGDAGRIGPHPRAEPDQRPAPRRRPQTRPAAAGGPETPAGKTARLRQRPLQQVRSGPGAGRPAARGPRRGVAAVGDGRGRRAGGVHGLGGRRRAGTRSERLPAKAVRGCADRRRAARQRRVAVRPAAVATPPDAHRRRGGTTASASSSTSAPSRWTGRGRRSTCSPPPIGGR